jgi:hypothetical protein
MGKELADGVAGDIASILQVDACIKRQLGEIDKRANLVQRRIIEIELRCAELRKGEEQEVVLCHKVVQGAEDGYTKGAQAHAREKCPAHAQTQSRRRRHAAHAGKVWERTNSWLG